VVGLKTVLAVEWPGLENTQKGYERSNGFTPERRPVKKGEESNGEPKSEKKVGGLRERQTKEGKRKHRYKKKGDGWKSGQGGGPKAISREQKIGETGKAGEGKLGKTVGGEKVASEKHTPGQRTTRGV